MLGVFYSNKHGLLSLNSYQQYTQLLLHVYTPHYTAPSPFPCSLSLSLSLPPSALPATCSSGRP